MRVISGKARGTRLDTLAGENTRPTLDRVKEALFNKIQYWIPDANILDLFAGSGALGIEAMSRGANRVIFCDKSYEAIQIIKRNLQKTHLTEKVEVIQSDYATCICKLKPSYDIIFIDPPYKANIAVDAVNKIVQSQLLSKNGIIILETDEEERDLKQLEKVEIQIKDIRKYGRIKLIFLSRKG